MARHQWLMAMEEKIIGFRTIAAADDVDVACAAGDDQSRLCALALDQRVDGGGRAVDQFIDGAGGKSAFADAVEDALCQLVRCGEAFGLHEFADLVVKADEVGERSSDVDRNRYHGGGTLWAFTQNATLMLAPHLVR